MRSRLINVARWLPRSRANGPGERFVLWVQGCGLGCEGCWNPDTWSFAPRRMMSVDALLHEVDQSRDVEGITLSGGEPFAQAEVLVPFVEGVRSRGLSVLIFTGHELAELRSRGTTKLLSLADIVVAGRYVLSRTVDLPLLASSNQRIHFISWRYGPEDLNAIATCEAHIEDDGSVRWTGFPTAFVVD